MKKNVLLMMLLILLSAGSLFAQHFTNTEIGASSWRMNYYPQTYGWTSMRIKVSYDGYNIWTSTVSSNGYLYTSQTTINAYSQVPGRTFLVSTEYSTDGSTYNSTGWYEWVTCLCLGPILTAPTYGSTLPAGTNSVNLTWGSSTNAASFKIYLGTTAGNMSFYTSTVSNSYALSNLNWGTTFYWSIRAVNNNSAESESNNIRVFYTPASPALTAPTISGPGSITANSFTAWWYASSYASWYYLDVATNSSFTSIVPGYNTLQVYSNSSSVTGLSSGTTYYYRVRAANNQLASSYSSYATALTLPGTTSLSSPANSATGVSNAPTISWTSPGGTVTGYYVYVGTNTPPTNLLNGTTNATTSQALSGLQYNTLYYWRVVAYNGSGSGTTSTTRTFTTLAVPAPAVPTSSAATDMTTISFSANWQTATYATKYYLDVATVSNFTPCLTNYNNLDVGNVLTKSVTGLSAGTTYYYRVRAYNTSGTSANSTMQTTATLPNAPVATDASLISTTGFRANWAATTGATSYFLDISTNNGFTALVTNYDNKDIGSALYCDATGLTGGTTYFYRVRAHGYSGTSSSSNVITMQTYQYPTITTQAVTSIAQTTAIGNGNITFLGNPSPAEYGHCWDVTHNPDTSGYHTSLGAVGTIGAFTSNLQTLLDDTLYYVRSYATSDGTTVYGDEVSFRTLPYAAGQAEIIQPLDGSGGNAISNTLNWIAPTSGGAVTAYQVYFGTTATPTTLVQNSVITSYTPSQLLYNQPYYWQIVTNNASGTTPGPIWSFTTIDQIVVPLDPVTTDLGQITTEVTIPDVTGSGELNVTVEWAPTISGFTEVGLYFVLTPNIITLPGRTITITHNLGFNPAQIAYRLAPAISWNYLVANAPIVTSWTTSEITFTLPSARADGDLEVLFPSNEDQALPVELSSFTAVFAVASNAVQLNWITQSETAMSGYYLYRSITNDLQSATNLNRFVAAENNSSEHQYTYQDNEIEGQGKYYYWLEALNMNGSSSFFGSITVVVGNEPGGDVPPVIPAKTMLLGIFPNPFNPVVNIAYSLKSSGTVHLSFYNLRGQKVHEATISHSNAGSYKYLWNADSQNLASGIYYVKMKCNNYHAMQKLVLSK